MLAVFRRERIEIDLTLSCFEHPEGTTQPYIRESFWRKPNAGMVLEAIRRLDIDPTKSAFLGDALRDMQAAQGGGIKKCLWLTQEQTAPLPNLTPPSLMLVRNYAEALTALSA